METPEIPRQNIAIFNRLYVIENVLRELVVEVLSATSDGKHWFKRRIPSDVTQKANDLKSREKQAHWTSMASFHPIYYLDFPTLQMVIIKRDNWNDGFKHVFPSEKVLQGTLTELEVIRNKIAHNRQATDADVRIVESAYLKLASMIGEKHFQALYLKSTETLDLYTIFRNLDILMMKSIDVARSADLMPSLEEWHSIKDETWFDDAYLGMSVDAIRQFFEVAELYANLSRTRGDGYKIDKWITLNEFETKYVAARNEIEGLLNHG